MDTVVGLTKALAWPVLAATLLVCFWKPLHTLVDTVPQLLSRSEEFSIGGASFHLRKSLVDQAPNDVKAILNNLGPKEVRLILEWKPNEVVCFPDPPPPEVRQPYTELMKLHLFEAVTPEEAKRQESEGYPCGYGFTTTIKFADIREFLIAAISEAIQQSRTLPRSKPARITETGAATR
ncbi:MAG: hypothetical protein ACLQVJ_13225 [Syntrophobacteraceae bacterium]